MSAILELKDVSKNYSGYTAVDHFNFSVNEGELRCLLGPNGAGKTTCLDLITGRQSITSGSILFRGKDISKLQEHEIVNSGIGRKFQVPAVFKELTVRDNFEVAFGYQKGPFANMRSVSLHTHNSKKYDEIVELTGLKDRLQDISGNLSHGETQWLEIGMVLMQDPSVLLMDEPTAGMTEQETRKTAEIFKSLKGSHTLIVVEHDMSFVREIADIITVMNFGELLAEGTISEIEKNSRVREVYLGSEGIS
jgi:urea transport system ATP-binding protein